MIVDVPYVIRRCKEDQADLEEDSESDDEEEEEERGVSGAMATEFDPEARINMLLVHGLLHLVRHSASFSGVRRSVSSFRSVLSL